MYSSTFNNFHRQRELVGLSQVKSLIALSSSALFEFGYAATIQSQSSGIKVRSVRKRHTEWTKQGQWIFDISADSESFQFEVLTVCLITRHWRGFVCLFLWSLCRVSYLDYKLYDLTSLAVLRSCCLFTAFWAGNKLSYFLPVHAWYCGSFISFS